MEMDFDFEHEKKQIVDIDGFIEAGKQFDLEIKIDEDRRNVIFGVVKDGCHEPVKNAVVKLIEVDKKERKPVSHTFTNEDGEFVFGPLCPDKKYAIDIWANKVEHIKICKHIKKERKCLKGVELHCEKPGECHEKYEYREKYEDEKK